MKHSIVIKTKDEIEKMKRSGAIAALVLETIAMKLKVGMTTNRINDLAEKIIMDHGAIPSFKGFGGYPSASCISINDEIVHGIPSERVIEDGDLVGIDIGVLLDGYHSDTAITVGVGEIGQEKQKLLNVTQNSLKKAILAIKPGIHLGDIQAIIQETIEKVGFSVIRDLTGHGIGQNLQEAPQIPNYGKKGTGLILEEGMTIAIEPMVATGTWRVEIKPDGWTVVTADKSLSAHFEHTIAITRNGSLILTQRQNS